MEIILGFALMAGLFFVLAHQFQKGNPLTGPIAFLLFTGFGVFTMNMMSSAIYTEWNNSDTYNSSMAVPETMMTLSFWSVWAWGLLTILGLIFWLVEWYGKQDGRRVRG